MKKLFLSLIALVMATMSFAQSTLVATLTHGEEIKMFYGTYALRDAHNAAENGDIINLSTGAFQSVKITKALTIRGAGSKEVGSTPTQIIESPTPTYIINNFDIEIPNTVTDRLSFEGCEISGVIYVQGTLSNAYFLKNRIQNVSCYGKIVNGHFVNTKIFQINLSDNSTANFINCEVAGCNINANGTVATFMNCNITPPYSNYGIGADLLRNAQLINCILYNGDNYYSFKNLPSTSSAINCVAVGKGSDYVFDNLPARQNCRSASLDIFHEEKYWLDLTDEAKATYLGNDGTPVGMFGGMMPFDLTPTYPQITKMNVANKTTADGKLSVEIEVSATE